ncbi:hypothetical protein GGS24DRAFT_453130 [Hypoxylon argillaceum]|nr:hypothetical protein GGS24DRAFT_453130 [Hypoxylon argillaceum]
MVPSPIAAPTPTPAPVPIRKSVPAHTPHTSHGRGRQTSASSQYPRSRSCSPAYGAWQSDHPRQRRPSFIERTQERIERSIHEHLVKAGQRPLPSFKVVKVTKSATEGELWGESREYPPPVPPKDEWIERIEKLVVLDDARGGGGGSRNPAAPEETRVAEDWDRSPGSKAEAKAEAAFFRAQERHWKASRRSAVAGARDAAFTSETGKGIPHLRIHTDIRNGSVPIGTALTTPHNDSYSSAVVDSETSLEPPSFSFEGGDKHQENAAHRLTSSRARDASRGSDNSLFLGRGNSAMDSPANYSFFSSEYAQRRVAANMDKYEITQRPQQHPPTHSSTNPHQGGQDEVAKSRGNRSCALSREQLGVASLPSAFEDLWQPFPFDDRCRLPSQAERQDVAAERSSLSRNHGAK